MECDKHSIPADRMSLLPPRVYNVKINHRSSKFFRCIGRYVCLKFDKYVEVCAFVFSIPFRI